MNETVPPQHQVATGGGGMMMSHHQFCLKWNNHSNNLLRVFGRLFSNESFTDVTLAAEGRSIRAHKVNANLHIFALLLFSCQKSR